MSVSPSTPTQFFVQTANSTVSLLWNISAGTGQYLINRSLDGVNFAQIGTSNLNNYLDTTTSPGVQYWYQVAAQAPGLAYATATLIMTGQPVPGQIFFLDGVAFTAVSGTAVFPQFSIGVTNSATFSNLYASISAMFAAGRLPDLAGPPALSSSPFTMLFTAAVAGGAGNSISFSVNLNGSIGVPFAGGLSGAISPFTASQTVVPAPMAEMSLLSLRTASQQKADRVNSQFVTTPEWNTFIGLAMYELYDLLITSYEDYFMAPRAQFISLGGSNFIYPLPNGVLSFTSFGGTPFIAPPFYKLLGVDLGLNTANNAFVTMDRYNFIDRNKFIYPNTSGTIYGVFNLQYRVMGTNIEFIPTPSAGQVIQLCYIPRLPQLLQDTDLTTIGFSGWLQYVIVRAAKYALDKEESDTSKLTEELVYIKGRIEEASQGRDAGRPSTISEVRNSGGLYGPGWNGSTGGF